MTGEHVGAQSDSLVGDPTLDAARARARAALESVKPRARGEHRYRIGDGDRCPVTDGHGQMFTLKGSQPPKQYCPDQSHDVSSRAIWPLHTFDTAVAAWRKTQQAASVDSRDTLDLSAMEGSH